MKSKPELIGNFINEWKQYTKLCHRLGQLYQEIFVNFSFFWHWVSFFLFPSIKMINVIYNKKRNKEKANVSATHAGPLQCQKLKDYFKMFVKDKNVEDS